MKKKKGEGRGLKEKRSVSSKVIYEYLIFYTIFFIILLGINALLIYIQISMLQNLHCETTVEKIPIQKNGIIYKKNLSRSFKNLSEPWEYTKLFDCECEVNILCDGRNLINQTLLGFNWMEKDYSRWCDEKLH